jgi:Flp pilus assembly pilin Flp
MLRLHITKRGQSAIEYVAILVVIIGAFIAMQSYAKRGLQGRWKQSVDQLGDQYDPRVADTHIVHRIAVNTDTSIITTNTAQGFWTTRRDITNSLETKSGYATVGAY